MISTFRFQNLKFCRENCMRLLRGCTHWGAFHPTGSATAYGKRCTRSGRAQCPPMGCATRSAQQARARIRVRGQLGPHQQVRHYAPPHRPDASYSAPHRSAVSTRPQWPLFLSGVTPLRGHYTSSELVQCSLTGVMLPNWCRAARHGSAGIVSEQQ